MKKRIIALILALSIFMAACSNMSENEIKAINPNDFKDQSFDPNDLLIVYIDTPDAGYNTSIMKYMLRTNRSFHLVSANDICCQFNLQSEDLTQFTPPFMVSDNYLTDLAGESRLHMSRYYDSNGREIAEAYNYLENGGKNRTCLIDYTRDPEGNNTYPQGEEKYMDFEFYPGSKVLGNDLIRFEDFYNFMKLIDFASISTLAEAWESFSYYYRSEPTESTDNCLQSENKTYKLLY